MYDPRRGPSTDIHSNDEVVEEEPRGAGPGTHFTGTLDNLPIRPGTILITDGVQRLTDNGNGVLGGDGTGTINYSTGAYVVDFTNAVVDGDPITANYEFDAEGSASGIMQAELVLTSSPVTARRQALRYMVSIESQQNFQAYFGENADVHLTAYMANDLAKAKAYKILRHLEQIAAVGPITWDASVPAATTGGWYFHKESFFDALIRGSNLIVAATQKMGANRFVGGTGVCSIIQTLQKFKAVEGLGKNMAGPRKIGEIGQFTCYMDPSMDHDRFMILLKDSNWLNTGYIDAPFQSVFITPIITLDDLVMRKAMMQRSGQKVINPYFYCTGQVVQTVPGNPFPNAI